VTIENNSYYVFTFETESVILYKRNLVPIERILAMLNLNQSDILKHRANQAQISFFPFYKMVGKVTVSQNCNPSIIDYFHKSLVSPHTLITK